MTPFRPKPKNGPEAKIQAAIVLMLRDKGWTCVETHGNAFQSGLPDIFACRKGIGHRWVEVKNPVAYSFTPAQRMIFPQLTSNGSGVWILVAATEQEYLKLMKPANWWMYLPGVKH